MILSQGNTRRHTLHPASGGSLDVAFAVTCPGADARCSDVGLRVTAERAGSPTSVLLDAVGHNPCWQSRRIDLSDLRGDGDIDISVSAEVQTVSAKPGEPWSAPVVLWAEPLWIHEVDQAYWNVVLISIDSLRADRLGSYGYDRETSPEIDTLASEAVRFEQAISQAPWTTPSHMTLLTSLYPTSHGVMRRGAGGVARLPGDVPTLAAILRQNGYRTLALTGGATIHSKLGFDNGFDIYVNGGDRLNDGVWSNLTTWLDEFGKAPFFLFFHTFEVHAPYTHPDMLDGQLSEAQTRRLRAFAKTVTGAQHLLDYLKAEGIFRKEVTSALYDGGIRYTDEFMGRFFRELKRRGLYDRTLIIVTADHGDEFGERNPERIYGSHDINVYDELIHVPLIIRLPDGEGRGRVIDDAVELVDVTPTILDLLGVAVSEGMQGQSLAPLIWGTTSSGDEWTLSEATAVGPEKKALRGRQYKYIATFAQGEGATDPLQTPIQEQLFDLERDPGEQRTLEEPELLRSMRRRLMATINEMEAVGDSEAAVRVDAEMKKQLKDLGYLE